MKQNLGVPSKIEIMFQFILTRYVSPRLYKSKIMPIAKSL